MFSLPNAQPAEKPDRREDGSLEVHSVFLTIQGEGPFAGRPAVFVRLAGCVLHCPQCFGVGVKSRIPYLSTSHGPKIRLDKVRGGEVLLTFDADFTLVETEVTRVIRREVSQWVELRIAGRTYDVTLEHPFFTTRGLIAAGDLRIGDDILETKPSDIIAYKKMGDRNPMKNPEVASKSASNKDWDVIGSKISNTRIRKFREGEIVSPYVMMSAEQQEEFRRKVSAKNRREGNGNWTGKYANLLDLQDEIDAGRVSACQRCSREGCRLLIHHKDGNHDNDTKDNLIVWCHQCHNGHHQRGYNFWNGRRKDGKQLIKKHNGQEVQKIIRCSGNLPVTNISCSPHNTYLANGMWVHNCDTDYTSTRVLMSPEELLALVEKERGGCPARLLVLTGGEPLRQNVGPFCRKATSASWAVQIETSGAGDTGAGWYMNRMSVVCSPKTPRISPEVDRLASAFKYVLDADHVNEDDGLPTSVLGMSQPPARPSYAGAVIYLQPADAQDAGKNKRNMDAAVASCLRFGYILSIQVHKIVGVP